MGVLGKAVINGINFRFAGFERNGLYFLFKTCKSRCYRLFETGRLKIQIKHRAKLLYFYPKSWINYLHVVRNRR